MKQMNPLRAIRSKCCECSGGSGRLVNACTNERCPLHPFRCGKDPFRHKRGWTEAERAEAGARLRAGRARAAQDERTGRVKGMTAPDSLSKKLL